VAFNVYNANSAPTAAGSVSLAPSGVATFVNRTGTTDNVTVASGVATINTTSANSAVSAYDLNGATATVLGASFPKKLTVVAGLTGTAPANVMEIDVPLSDTATTQGGRVKFLVRSSSLRIENFNGCSGNHIDFSSINTTGFHTYQLAIEQPNEASLDVRVYMDGVLMTGTYVIPSPQAAASATCDPTNAPTGTATSFRVNRKAATAGQNFVSFGEASTGTQYSGSLDWLIWTRDNAFTPAELLGKLPSGLGVTTGY
jgi:hypothetical protein